MRLDFAAIRSHVIIASAVDAVFPPRCAGCGHRGVWVCKECRPSVTLLSEPWCDRCGIPKDSRCRCHELSQAIAVSRSAAAYSGWIRRAIHLMKYENEPARIPSLVELLVPVARSMPAFDAFAPVPLHGSRFRRRGYNQAELIAVHLGAHLETPVERCLTRTRSTRHQVGLSGDERRLNLTGAFAVDARAGITGKRLVLIDDVMTTGSTLNACADALMSAGAAWVGTLTIAREM